MAQANTSEFLVNDVNLALAKGLLAQGRTVYLHGDGNIYDDELNSNFRKNFSNQRNQAAQYRVILKTLNDLPQDVAALCELLYKTKNQENAEEKAADSLVGTKVKTFTLPKTAVAAPDGAAKTQAQLDEEQLQAEIAEEAKAKATGGKV